MPKHNKSDKGGPTALIVHGGAGSRGLANERGERKRAIMDAVKAGASILRDGGNALDAVIASVVILEDDPLFNAGYGSTLNADGAVEMDASVMVAVEGETKAGAVAIVSRVKNPVRLARAVMEHTPHVMMSGNGAERFARDHGIKLCDPDAMIAPRARERFQARLKAQQETGFVREEHGTVGAAAVDSNGRLAAATSTGGVPGKMPGRIGDSAIIGAGTFANQYAAASATGHGEAIIMTSLCRETVQGLGEAPGKSDPTRSARRMIAELIVPQNSEAGVILVDRRGRIGYAHNAEAMEVGIYNWVDGTRHQWAASMPRPRKLATEKPVARRGRHP
jgi:beta-aspartyl-peptidase (threonine type)